MNVTDFDKFINARKCEPVYITMFEKKWLIKHDFSVMVEFQRQIKFHKILEKKTDIEIVLILVELAIGEELANKIKEENLPLEVYEKLGKKILEVVADTKIDSSVSVKNDIKKKVTSLRRL